MGNEVSLEQRVKLKISAIDKVAHDLPCVIIIHNLFLSRVEYMSQRGLDILGVDINSLKSLGPEYFDKYFNPEDSKDYTARFLEVLKRNINGEMFTFFQQVRGNENELWEWYLSSSTVILRDIDKTPLLSLTMAQTINSVSNLNHKVERLLDENNFLKNNFSKFSLLTKREKEVLSLIACGYSNLFITNKLFISINTVETHRKTIKHKLQACSTYELIRFARAFDLI
jgi:DNA-binding CsgD family transcriptional regulator